jgi:general secretion pathway protein D
VYVPQFAGTLQGSGRNVSVFLRYLLPWWQTFLNIVMNPFRLKTLPLALLLATGYASAGELNYPLPAQVLAHEMMESRQPPVQATVAQPASSASAAGALAPLPAFYSGTEPMPAGSAASVMAPLPGSGSATTGAESDDSGYGKKAHVLLGNDQVIAAPKPVPQVRGTANAFNFDEAPIADVVNVVLGDILKVQYVLHTPIAGTVTLSTRGPISADKAVYLLETALQANGLVMAQDSRGVYHVGKPESLKGIVVAPRQVSSTGNLAPGTGPVIIQLKYIGAAEMATILKPVVPPEAAMRVDAIRNLLVLSGSRAQAEGWLDIVKTFDVDLLKGMSVGLFPLKYASIADVETALHLIAGGAAPSAVTAATAAGAKGGPPSRFASAVAGAGGGAAGDTGAEGGGETITQLGGARIMPIARLNSILVISPRAGFIDEARRWIEKLDRPNDNSTEAQLNVYEVQNGSAAHLAEVLGGIYGGASPGQGGANSGVAPTLGSSTGISSGMGSARGGSGFSGVSAGSAGGYGASLGGSSGGLAGGGGGSFGVGSAGNTFGGSTALGGMNGQSQQGANQGVQAYGLGGNVRVIADQVNNALLVYAPPAEYRKIEATLRRLDVRQAQVLLEANIIEITLTDELKYGLEWAFKNGGGNGYSGTGVLSTIDGGTLGGALAGFSYTIANGMGSIRGILNALANKSLVKVISSPSLMVLDNYTAAIQVGDQVPVQTGTTITAGVGVTSSIQYKDTGVQLEVTPTVNAGNIVTMQLTQAVTDVGVADRSGNLPFKQRLIKSKVAVRSGEALVLGGLIRDNTGTGRAGIPFLQDLPIIGSAFGATTVTKNRTELIVVLVPRVVRSDEDIRDLGGEFRQQMKSFSVIDDLKPTGRLGSKLPNPNLVPRPNN